MNTFTASARRSVLLLALAAAPLSIGACMSQRSIETPAVPALNPETDFATTRTLDAPPERVWQAWTDGEQLQRWWGPTGFTCPLAQMDVREGGTSVVVMRAPPQFGGQDYYNTWTYSIVIPLRRLDFIVRFTDADGTPYNPADRGMPAGIPPEVPHVLIFEPEDGGRTKLTIIEYGYGSQDAMELSRRGLEQCLDKLAEVLAR